jgi:small-conductance mechanosensitive channel
VLQRALDDFYVRYELNVFIDNPKQMLEIYSALHANIQNSFFEEGIEIMSPHIYAHRDGSKAAFPENYPISIRKGRNLDSA